MRAIHLRVLLWVLCKDFAGTTVPEIAHGIGRSRERTRQALVELRDAGLVVLIGYTQGARWFGVEVELDPRRWRPLPAEPPRVSRATHLETVGS
jgi:hypothetical protein